METSSKLNDCHCLCCWDCKPRKRHRPCWYLSTLTRRKQNTNGRPESLGSKGKSRMHASNGVSAWKCRPWSGNCWFWHLLPTQFLWLWKQPTVYYLSQKTVNSKVFPVSFPFLSVFSISPVFRGRHAGKGLPYSMRKLPVFSPWQALPPFPLSIIVL